MRCWPACFECFCQLKDNLRDCKIYQWNISHKKFKEKKHTSTTWTQHNQPALTLPLQMHAEIKISTRKCNKAMMHVQGKLTLWVFSPVLKKGSVHAATLLKRDWKVFSETLLESWARSGEIQKSAATSDFTRSMQTHLKLSNSASTCCLWMLNV